MSYKIIEKNEYGIRVRNYSEYSDCNLCKNVVEKNTCNRSECAPNSYYLPDSEVERLEVEANLKAKIEELESRIKEMEKTIENNVTELIHRTGDLTHDFWYFCQECGENFEMDHGFNYCPNCGRKILR